MALNKFIAMGRIGKDIELRRTNSGDAVASFPLAVDRDYKEADGKAKTDWLDVTCWRGTAEFVSKFMSKGRNVVVEGRLQIREWTDKDGNKRRNAEIVAERVYFADSKREDGGQQASYAAPPAQMSGFAEIREEDGELPF